MGIGLTIHTLACAKTVFYADTFCSFVAYQY